MDEITITPPMHVITYGPYRMAVLPEDLPELVALLARTLEIIKTPGEATEFQAGPFRVAIEHDHPFKSGTAWISLDGQSLPMYHRQGSRQGSEESPLERLLHAVEAEQVEIE